MQKSVNPIIAILVISFFAGLLLLYVWAGQQWLQLDRFGLAKTVDAEQFVVQYGNRLLWVNKDFSVARELPLGVFGQKSFTGDIDFFANGDLLLALNQKSLTAEQQMAVLNRAPNRTIDGEGKLYRCNTESYKCIPFGAKLPVINRTFRLYIDEQDQVILADTSRHQLWLLDKEGNILANKEGFRFPNQMVPQGKNLVLADTNHHALKIIKSSVDEFGAELESISIGLSSPSDWFNKGKTKYSWPVNIAWVNNTYWVLVGENNLSYSRLALYNLAGKFERELPLPAGADPISILVFDNKVLVIDLALYQTHQFSMKGEFLGSVAIADAGNTVTFNAKESRKWKALQENAIIVFVLGLVLGFIAAIVDYVRSRRSNQAIPLARRQEQALKRIPEQGIWLEVNPSLRRSAKLIPFLVAVIVFCLLVLCWLYPQTIVNRIPMLVFLIATVIFSVPYMRATYWRIGIFRDRVELIDYRQARYSQAYDTLLWSDTGFKIDTLVVPFRKGAKRGLFPYQEITDLLLPLFNSDKKIGQIAMLKYQWHSPDKMLKACALILCVCLVIIIISSAK